MCPICSNKHLLRPFPTLFEICKKNKTTIIHSIIPLVMGTNPKDSVHFHSGIGSPRFKYLKLNIQQTS